MWINLRRSAARAVGAGPERGMARAAVRLLRRGSKL
jgi:hypothetical protein